MFFISDYDGIPSLTDDELDPQVQRLATDKEIQVFNDFWGLYWDEYDPTTEDIDAYDEKVRRAVLTKHGMEDRI